MQGVVSDYDPLTRSGVVVAEPDRTPVYLRPESALGGLFRSLRPGQRIIFDTEEEQGRLLAVRVRIGSDGY